MNRSHALVGQRPRRKAAWLAVALAVATGGAAAVATWAVADEPQPPASQQMIWKPMPEPSSGGVKVAIAPSTDSVSPVRRSQAIFSTLGIQKEAPPAQRLPDIRFDDKHDVQTVSASEPVSSHGPAPRYVGRIEPLAPPAPTIQAASAAHAGGPVRSEPAMPPLPAPERSIEVVHYQAEAGNAGQVTNDFEVIPQTGQLEVNVGRSLLLRTKHDMYRTAVVDPRVCEVIQFTPREVSIIGKGVGATHVTFWFRDGDGVPVTYLVKVAPDPVARQRIEQEYFLLENLVAKLFPDSKVYLMQVADKLIVRGQAKDIEEAAQIMTVIRGNAGRGARTNGNGYGLGEGLAASVLTSEETGRTNRPRVQVINMLRVPGVQQVALRVKIAELNRTAARGIGVDVDARINFSDNVNGSALFIESMLNAGTGGAPALLAQFDGDDIQIGINYLQQRGVVRLLSEPTVVTMSGQPATFVAGGEFAVPTVVGTAGLNAITTDFRSFGAIISFLPTVIDKDRVRLQVSPEFSQINNTLSVGSTPGLNVRAVTTTVEMREGQTLAIAGLLEDSMTGNTQGNVPGLSWLIGNRSMSRNETELIILVTPELVHPMEPDEVPPLPGFDVTEPTNAQFFLHNRLEGTPTMEYRSTVWPHLKHRYKAGGSAMISGPFGHAK